MVEIVISIQAFLLTISHFLNSQEMRSYHSFLLSFFYLYSSLYVANILKQNKSLAIAVCLRAFWPSGQHCRFVDVGPNFAIDLLLWIRNFGPVCISGTNDIQPWTTG